MQRSIHKRFTWGIVKVLCKNKHGGDGISNFCSLIMLNADLKVLAKIMAKILLAPNSVVLLRVGLSRSVFIWFARSWKKSTVMPHWSIEAFDRVDHGFLEAVLSADGFGFHFRSWILSENEFYIPIIFVI